MHVVSDVSALERAMTRKDFQASFFFLSRIENLLLGVQSIL